MTSINPINVNTQGVSSSVGFGISKKEAKEAEGKEKEVKGGVPQTPVSADKVFEYLSANSAAVKPKTVDPAKYVDDASADRIAEFMKGFEEKVAQGLKAFDEEFAGVEVSEAAKMAVVLKQVESESL